jgi:UDP-N-acetylmuramoyl-tripeptide--D-alanyl-D-alanine ligase
MTLATILILIILGFLIFIRVLRWLAIFQQKEYRWDRCWTYLKTDSGQQDLIKFIPRTKDLTRTGLKRPKITLRVGAMAGFLSVVLLLVGYVLISQAWLAFVLGGLMSLLLVPVLVLIANVPAQLAYFLQTQIYLKQAQQIIRDNQPMMIGITGSYGKTSTKLLLAHVLAAKFEVFATQRSFNKPFSLAREIVHHYNNQEIVILEFAAYKLGEINYLASKFPADIAVITGLTTQHLATFNSLDNIIKAKAELLQNLKQENQIFINGTDSGTELICNQAKVKEYIKYADKNSQLNRPTVTTNGRLQFFYRKQLVKTKLIGHHYFSAVAAAIAVAEKLGLTREQIVKALTSFEPPAYFVGFHQTGDGYWLLDDGRTSNPVGFKAIIELVQQIKVQRQKKGRSFKQVGLITSGMIDLGSESNQIHQQLARQAQPIFDFVCYSGKPGLSEFKRYFKDQAIIDPVLIKTKLDALRENDLLVIEGKIPNWLRKYLT